MEIYLKNNNFMLENNISNFYKKIGLKVSTKINKVSESKWNIIIKSNNNDLYNFDMYDLNINCQILLQDEKKYIIEKFEKEKNNMIPKLISDFKFKCKIDYLDDQKKKLMANIFCLYLCKNNKILLNDEEKIFNNVKKVYFTDDKKIFEANLYEQLKKYQIPNINFKWIKKSFFGQIKLFLDKIIDIIMMDSSDTYIYFNGETDVKFDKSRYGLSNLNNREKLILLLIDIGAIFFIMFFIVFIIKNL